MKNITAIDFFCGMGGASLGLENAGFNVLKGYDIFEDALKTHKHNLPNIDVENIDITQLDTKSIPSADLYHFSCPCQSFSTAGKRDGVYDFRGQLIYQTIRILKDKKPKCFTFENVKGLATYDKGNILNDLIIQFEEIGYDCYYKILNAYDYSVVQNRKRLFIVGFKKDLNIKYTFPNSIHNDKVLKDAIGHIKENKGIPNHSNSLISKLIHIPQGGCVLDIPQHIRPKAFKNSYKRLKWDDIPPTITGQYNCPSSANCIHPDEHRGLSDTEALLIQSFDESWEVLGKQRNVQIGNCVPPKLMEVIAGSIRDSLVGYCE